MATDTGTITAKIIDDVPDPWATLAAAIENGHGRVLLVDLDFAPDPVRVHSSIGDLVHDGRTFIGVGTLGGLSDLDPGADLSAPEIQARLALVGQSALRATLALGGYQGRGAEILLGVVDNESGVLIDAVPIWWGFIDRAMIEESDEASVAVVNLTDELARHDTPSGGTYTHEDQIARHPGDLFLQHVQSIQDMEIPWGPTS